MRYKEIYERRQSVGRMEAFLLATSLVGLFSGVWALLAYAWIVGLVFFLLSILAYAQAELFGLLSDLMGAIGRIEEATKSKGTGEDRNPVR